MMIVIVYLCVCLITGLCEAQFPAICVSNATRRGGICCPMYRGQVCGGPGRGACLVIANITERYQPSLPFFYLDDRANWPLRFFQYACACEGNFDGYKCHECKPGYTGSKCLTKHIFVRRNILHMKKSAVEEFKIVLNRAKYALSDYMVINTSSTTNTTGPYFVQVSVYDLFVFLHFYPTMQSFIKSNGTCSSHGFIAFAHEGSGFLTWHRKYILFWEKELRKLSKRDDYALPYWDWRSEGSSCQVCSNVFMGATDPDGHLNQASIFLKWRQVCIYEGECKMCDVRKRFGRIRRRPGKNPDVRALPSDEDVEYCTGLQQYDIHPYGRNATRFSFRNCLEGFSNSTTDGRSLRVHSMHNQVHLLLNGTMSHVPSSANDPIFLLHHAFVDKLFEVWYRKQTPALTQFPGTGAPIGHNRHTYMVPFFPVVEHSWYFTGSKQLGYDYTDMTKYGSSATEHSTCWRHIYHILLVSIAVGATSLLMLLTFAFCLCCRDGCQNDILHRPLSSSPTTTDVGHTQIWCTYESLREDRF